MSNSPFVKAMQVIKSCNSEKQFHSVAKFIALAARHYDDGNHTFRRLKWAFEFRKMEIKNA